MFKVVLWLRRFSRQCATAKVRFRSQGSLFEMYGGQSSTGTGFVLSTYLPLSVSFHQCSILVFIYMLLLPEGQTGEAWEPSKTQFTFGNRRSLDRKYFQFFVLFCFKGLCVSYGVTTVGCFLRHVTSLRKVYICISFYDIFICSCITRILPRRQIN